MAVRFSETLVTSYSRLHGITLQIAAFFNSYLIYTSCVSFLIFQFFKCCRQIQLKCDGTRWRTEGEAKGKLASRMGSQYSSHYLGTWCNQHYYHCSHFRCRKSTEQKKTRRFKWTLPFRRKKSGFCACAITFQKQSTVNLEQHPAVGVVRVQPSHNTDDSTHPDIASVGTRQTHTNRYSTS